MKTAFDAAIERFPALRSPGAMLAANCALEWYELTPADAEVMFTADCVYQNRCDQGTLVVGPAEIYKLLDVYRSMCERFEGVLLNILEADGVVLLEREEITHLKDGRSFCLPVMDSFVIRDGKIASFREYWDLALLTQHLDGTATGDEATEAFEQYKSEA
ncbi:MAG: nuclear transport factor 2 family protein [Deltaproteobacteria bacterium]|nr:nuclear transport factor 2 family protein [Deltaproteobacteria bacterium]